MRKSTIVALAAAWALSGSAFAQEERLVDRVGPDTPVLLADGMTTVVKAMEAGASDEEIEAGIVRAEQRGPFLKGILDRDTVRDIDAGKLIHLNLLSTVDSDTGCRGPDRYLVHVPGYPQPRCLIFTAFL